jgi:hypothetical protein
LWTDAALETLFKHTNELPFFQHSITAYGKGTASPSDAPIIEAITSIPGIWYIHYNGVQGDLTIKALSTPGASLNFPLLHVRMNITYLRGFIDARNPSCRATPGFGTSITMAQKVTWLSWW